MLALACWFKVVVKVFLSTCILLLILFQYYTDRILITLVNSTAPKLQFKAISSMCSTVKFNPFRNKLYTNELQYTTYKLLTP